MQKSLDGKHIPGKKVKSKVVSISLPSDLLVMVDELCPKLGRNRSNLVATALWEYLKSQV